MTDPNRDLSQDGSNHLGLGYLICMWCWEKHLHTILDVINICRSLHTGLVWTCFYAISKHIVLCIPHLYRLSTCKSLQFEYSRNYTTSLWYHISRTWVNFSLGLTHDHMIQSIENGGGVTVSKVNLRASFLQCKMKWKKQQLWSNEQRIKVQGHFKQPPCNLR